MNENKTVALKMFKKQVTGIKMLEKSVPTEEVKQK